jgi:hypothetical protein
MRKPSLRITITFHKDGTLEVLIEWVVPQHGLLPCEFYPLLGIIVGYTTSPCKQFV